MSDPLPPTDLPRENAELRRELARCQRRLQQAERVAAASETISNQSKRAMLRTQQRLEATIGELTQAKASAEDANRAKGRFLATISHEMRTPLNGIVGSLEILKRTELDTEQGSLVGVIHRSTTALMRIINDVLDFSKIEAGAMDIETMPFDLAECVHAVAELESGAAQHKGITIATQIEPLTPACVSGDPNRLRQVLLNLVDNAVKFTQRGEVHITVGPGDADDVIEFAVRDTGIGISADALGHIFDAFTQEDSSTTRRFGGTGLGLAICKRLVGLMGGEIRVDSEAGVGTAFTFTCRMPACEQVARKRDSGLIPLGNFGLRALVVDDNESNRFLARKMLERLGCTIEAAENGAQALDRVGKEAFDVIFMDCSMPVMDGFEATQLIRTRGSDVPIVAMTANAMPEDRTRCLQAGMNEYLAKPVRIRALEDTLRNLGW